MEKNTTESMFPAQAAIDFAKSRFLATCVMQNSVFCDFNIRGAVQPICTHWKNEVNQTRNVIDLMNTNDTHYKFQRSHKLSCNYNWKWKNSCCIIKKQCFNNFYSDASKENTTTSSFPFETWLALKAAVFMFSQLINSHQNIQNEK